MKLAKLQRVTDLINCEDYDGALTRLNQQDDDTTAETLGHELARDPKDTANIKSYLKLFKLLRGKLGAQHILSSLSLANKWGWTMGHCLAAGQDVERVFLFFNLLQSMLDNAIMAKKAVGLLAKQTTKGWTIPHNLARHNIGSSIDALLDFLLSALERLDTIDPILDLMSTLNDEHESVNLVIVARDSGLNIEYSRLFNQLYIKCSTPSHLARLFFLLSEADRHGATCAHLLLRKNDEYITQALFSRLESALVHPGSTALLNFLTEEDGEGNTLIDLINTTVSYSTAIRYYGYKLVLNTLTQFQAEKGSNTTFDYLMTRFKANDNFGMLLPFDCSWQPTKLFDELMSVLQLDLGSQKIFNLIKHLTNNFLTLYASLGIKDSGFVLFFIKLLFKLQADLGPKPILKLLTTSDSDGGIVGHQLLSKNATPECVFQFLSLAEALIKELGSPYKVYSLLTILKKNSEKSMLLNLIDACSRNPYFLLIALKLDLLQERGCCLLLDSQALLLRFIQMLDEDEQNTILSEIVKKPENGVGQYLLINASVDCLDEILWQYILGQDEPERLLCFQQIVAKPDTRLACCLLREQNTPLAKQALWQHIRSLSKTEQIPIIKTMMHAPLYQFLGADEIDGYLLELIVGQEAHKETSTAVSSATSEMGLFQANSKVATGMSTMDYSSS